AAAPLPLLMTADLLGTEPHALANKQRATSFRGINLVRRKRKQITAERFNVDRNSAGGLHRVSVQPQMASSTVAFRAHQRANLGNRLHGPDFSVSHHDANQDRGGSHRPAS